MQVYIRLHGALRDKMSAEANGQMDLEIEAETAISDILSQFSLRGHIQVAINEEIVDDLDTVLHDGDQVDVFRPAAGG